MTVECLVYRPDAVAVNVFGDAVDNDGNVIRPESTQTYLGPLRIALSGVQAEPILSRLTGSGGGSVDRAEAADVNLMIGAPRHAAIKLRHGDRLIVPDSDGDGTSLVVQVVGPRLFDAPNSLTPGWDHRLYWISGLPRAERAVDPSGWSPGHRLRPGRRSAQ